MRTLDLEPEADDGAGGAANAYFPSAEEEQRVRQQEEQLRQARDASRDRLREIECGEKVNQSPKS